MNRRTSMCRGIKNRTTPTSQYEIASFCALGRQINIPNTFDINPRVFPSQESKKTRIDDVYTKSKKHGIDQTISKWFQCNRILTHVTSDTYYRAMVSKT